MGKGSHNGADGVLGEAVEDETTQIDGEDAAAVVEEEGADDVAATSQLRSGVVVDEGSSRGASGHGEVARGARWPRWSSTTATTGRGASGSEGGRRWI